MFNSNLKDLRKENFSLFSSYCDSYKLPIVTSEKSNQKYITIHKNVFQLNEIINILKINNSYLNEAHSDYLTAFFLARSGLLKAAVVNLRGTIENFMRYLCDQYSDGQHVIDNTFSNDLFSHNKSFFGTHTDIKDSINNLSGVYSFCCKFSHSSDTNSHSNYTSLVSMEVIDDRMLAQLSSQFQTIYDSLSVILFYIFYNIDDKYRMNILAKYRDEFIELIPNKVKSNIKNI